MRETLDNQLIGKRAGIRVDVGEHLIMWVHDNRIAPLDCPVMRPAPGHYFKYGIPAYRLTSDYQSAHFLRQDVHQWLADRHIDYWLCHVDIPKDQWQVYIEDREIAILFKLTWGGQ